MKAYKQILLLIAALASTTAYSQIPIELAEKVADSHDFSWNVTRMLVDSMESLYPYGSLPEKKRDEVFKEIRRITSPKKLYDTVITKLTNSLTKKEAESIISWHNSDFGKQLALEQEFINHPNGKEAWSRRLPALLKESSNIDNAEKIGDLLLLTETHYKLALYTALTTRGLRAIPSRPKITPKHFSALESWVIEKSGESLSNDAYKITIATIVLQNRNLKPNEVQKYISFLETGASKKLAKAIESSIEEVLFNDIAPQIFKLNYETYPTIDPEYKIQISN